MEDLSDSIDRRVPHGPSRITLERVTSEIAEPAFSPNFASKRLDAYRKQRISKKWTRREKRNARYVLSIPVVLSVALITGQLWIIAAGIGIFVVAALLVFSVAIDVHCKGHIDELEKPKRDAKVLADKNIVCPHCQHAGAVRTCLVKRKKGISGGKATAALLTGGVSMLATGLSRKEVDTQATCSNCRSVWYF